MGVSRVVASAMLVASLAFLVPAGAALADSEMPETGATTYQLDPGKRVVHVSVVLTEKNNVPSTVAYVTCTKWEWDFSLEMYLPVSSTCPQTTNYYIDTTYLWLEQEARNLKASATGGAAAITADGAPKNGFRRYKVTYPATYRGQSRTVTVKYDLPGGKPRSEAFTRAGAAYARFCVTPNGTDGGTVRAVLPAGFLVSRWGDELSDTSSGSATVLESGNVTDVYKYSACIEGSRPDAFRETRIEVPGTAGVLLAAWPEDGFWASHVAGDVKSALPALEKLIGFQAPGTGDITVQEAAATQLGDGYAGDYAKDERVARISEDYERSTVIHELAHAWFNPAFLGSTWMSEGYAGYAEHRLTQATPCAKPGAYPAAASPNLENWTYVDQKSTEIERDVVTYNYDAACYIVTAASGRLDDAHLRAVFAALRDGRDVYTGAPGPSSVSPADWKRWLDVIDEVGLTPDQASADLLFTQDLLVKYGIASSGSFAGRAAARQAYHKLKASADDWSLPFAITDPMAKWSFTQAEEAIAAASDVLAGRNALAAAAPDVTEPMSVLKNLFESAKTTIDLVEASYEVAGVIQRIKDASDAVEAAEAAVEAPREFVQSVGLLGAQDPRLAAEAASQAFKEGRWDDAKSQAADAMAEMSEAGPQGSTRVAVASIIGVIGVLLLLVVFALVLRRRRARPSLAVVPAYVAASVAPGGVETGAQDANATLVATAGSLLPPDPAPAPVLLPETTEQPLVPQAPEPKPPVDGSDWAI